MTICETAAQAATGLRTGAAANLFNALNLIAAADVAIRVGSGGQAGATDLPRLVTDERGIECYSPELGESIWVTPLQWYANGMSCSGLRDPDREALERRIRELQERARLRNEIRRQGFNLAPNSELPLNSDELRRLNEQIKNAGIANGFGGNGGGIEFLIDGIFVCNWNYGTFSDYYVGADYPNPNGHVTNYAVKKDDKIISESISPHGYYFKKDFYLQKATGGRELIPGGVEIMIQGRTPPRYTGYRGPDIWGWTGQFSPATYEFKPNASPPPTNNSGGSGYPINPQSPEPPEENNCMGGCSCGDIAQATRQNTQAMERLIKEIHNAVNAGTFASGTYQYNAEANVESMMRKLYPGGKPAPTRVANLAELATANAAAQWFRIGLKRFPALVPDELIPKSNAALEAMDREFITVESLADFTKWWFDQWDAATGEYPIKFKVKDKENGRVEERPLNIWNQAEGIAEIIGMNLKIMEDADIGVQAGIRATSEAAGAKIASYKALVAAEQIIEALGVLTKKKREEIQLSFTPNPFGSENAEDMLKPSSQPIDTIDVIDGRSILGILLNLNYHVQIASKAVQGDPKYDQGGQPTFVPGDGIKEARKRDKQAGKGFKKDWDKWTDKVKNKGFVPESSNQQQPRGGFPKPDLLDLGTDPGDQNR